MVKFILTSDEKFNFFDFSIKKALYAWWGYVNTL